MSLALCADLRLASPEAVFSMAFVKIGLHPDWGGSVMLSRLVNPSVAAELMLTGESLGAERAQALGLVNRVVPADQLETATEALAQRLAQMPSRALAATRRAVDEALALDYAAALSNEARLQGEMSRGHDFEEGVTAFLEKRAPVFRDR